ncbi:hypothetical protein ACLKA7_017673 [Drosophila subpalustris]
MNRAFKIDEEVKQEKCCCSDAKLSLSSVHRCLLSAISVTICIVTSDRRVGERNHGVQQRYHFGSTVRTVTIVRSWSVPVYPWRASLPSPATAVTVCTVVVIGVGERNHGLQQRYHFGSTVRTVTTVSRVWFSCSLVIIVAFTLPQL